MAQTAISRKTENSIGTTRNLTEVFILLRSNAQQTKLIYNDDASTTFRGRAEEERMTLIELEENSGPTSSSAPNREMLMSVMDEVELNFVRIQRKLDELSEIQLKHLSRPNFGDEAFEAEEKKMELETEEITKMLSKTKSMIRVLSNQNSDEYENESEKKIRANAASALNLTLTQLTDKFRTRQLKYLNDIQSRSKNLDSFLLTGTTIDEPNWAELDALSPSTEYTMSQLEQFVTNDKEVREREKEVLAVNSSIRELNNLFQDMSQMIIDQGTILDRIDYNVEQSTIRVSKAVGDVMKAERHQRNNKKMHCIFLLTMAIIIVLLLIIFTKL